MRSGPTLLFIAFAVSLALSIAVLADSGPAKAPPPHPGKQRSFNPRNLNGIWSMVVRRQLVISNDRPPLTPWGQAKLSKVRGSFPNEALGIKRFPEKEWNDPLFRCDPAGYPRTLQQIFGEIVRFVQAPDELLEFFEWDHTWRDIWTDGRKLHDDPEPRYYGYSVGRWEGDTFVVESNGFNDRTWLDAFGDVHSDQMRLRETFRRVDQTHLEWTVTVDDPMTYTRPWGPSEKRLFELVPKSPRSEHAELREDFCVWSDSADFFRDVDSVGLGDAPAKGNK